jgi:hypothetical protein
MKTPVLMPENGVLTIAPHDIDCSQHFWNAFDHSETETSANWIVRLCQELGGWQPFTRATLEAFYARKHKDGFTFNRLEEGKHFVITTDPTTKEPTKVYRMTVEFVTACYKSSPAKRKAA